MRKQFLGVLLLGASTVLAGCAQVGTGSVTAADQQELTVFAAASLTESFDSLAKTFEQEHPGTKVVLSYGGSSTLATQIVQGAPADVFAAASPTTMDTVRAASLTVGAPQTFATNELMVVTPPTDTKVQTLADLAKPELAVVLCDAAVPCGAISDKLFAAAKVVPAVDSREPDVKSVLAKVRSGDADAGVVYVTDAKAAGSAVRSVPVPAAVNQSTKYQLAAIAGRAQVDLATAWVALVTGETGRKVLAAQGFSLP